MSSSVRENAVAKAFGESTEDWHVVHTLSRQEKALAGDLAAMGIPHYLPLQKKVRYYGARKAAIQDPLFPGYLFVRGSVDDTYRADRTGRVANLIKVRDQSKLDWELRNIHLALSNDAALEPYAHLVKGKRVTVKAGPFRGLQGVVETGSDNGRLILQVDALGQAVSLEIDGSLLEAIE